MKQYRVYIKWDMQVTTCFDTVSFYTENGIRELCDWFITGNDALDSWALPLDKWGCLERKPLMSR